MSGIYPRTFTNVCCLEEDSFIREKVIAKRLFLQLGVWGRTLAGFLGAKGPKIFGFSMSLRQLNGLQWH